MAVGFLHVSSFSHLALIELFETKDNRSNSFTFLKNRLYFLEEFEVHSKTKRRYRDLQDTVCLGISTLFPMINVLHQLVTFVTKSIVYLMVHSGRLHCIGFSKCIMTHVHHYRIAQRNLIALVSFLLGLFNTPPF